MFPIHDDNQRLHGRPFVNYILIAINIIIFIWEMITTNFFSNSYQVAEFFLNFGAVPNSVLNGDVISLVTSMFLHGDSPYYRQHGILIYFGDNIEDRFGHVKYFFFICYVVLLRFGYSFYAVSVGSGEIPSVGASGAISGVLGAYLVMFPKAKIYTIITAFIITTVRIPALAYIPFWFILQVIFNFIDPLGGVAYFAHIGGFLAGAGISFFIKILFPSFFQRQNFRAPINFSKRSETRTFSNANYRPDILEGNDFYEILVEVKGPIVNSEISATYDQNYRILKIFSSSDPSIFQTFTLPNSIKGDRVSYVSILNGIARVRISKTI
jgi:membrane associated rhomboid family serine protease